MTPLRPCVLAFKDKQLSQASAGGGKGRHHQAQMLVSYFSSHCLVYLGSFLALETIVSLMPLHLILFTGIEHQHFKMPS